MMSAALSETMQTSTMESLQCHFNWDLEPTSRLLQLRDKLKDIGTEEGNRWLGHIYNLQGFIQYKLGFNEDAKSLFSKAAEAFHELRHADEGPWLLVNYGNLAWLHYHLGDEAESQAYLSKVDALMKNHPSPSQGELHPEVYAEKAWTLMYFAADRKVVADYFEKAIRMQPDMVEWNTSHVIGLVSAHKHSDAGVEDDLLEKMRHAKEQDPENVYLAALYLEQLAKKGARVEAEIFQLANKVLRSPVSSYSGMKAVLRLYRNYISVNEAIDLAEKALEEHPDERYLKMCVALCYRWKIIHFSDGCHRQSILDKAICLYEDLLSLYPHFSLMKEIDLASLYAKSSDHKAKAEQIYQQLLDRDLEPAEKQVLYNHYAYYLFYDRKDSKGSVQYHMKAAEITQQSFYKENSIKLLETIRDKGKHPMCQEIKEFLKKDE
ncbi:interferon-induced protein with tetratricopeptide repeats 1-like [Notolabrus celidotus]|uniref:interferon-induced protein with tetratricopeptide repeats 1-like n=1 Tax=Notolabrus celidotus TaxID=1203425 RepID=UPI00148F4619|nr:interferon-induced protein with tetratricopeptide repeats 1-like [Notolabrus celidotus]